MGSLFNVLGQFFLRMGGFTSTALLTEAFLSSEDDGFRLKGAGPSVAGRTVRWCWIMSLSPLPDTFFWRFCFRSSFFARKIMSLLLLLRSDDTEFFPSKDDGFRLKGARPSVAARTLRWCWKVPLSPLPDAYFWRFCFRGSFFAGNFMSLLLLLQPGDTEGGGKEVKVVRRKRFTCHGLY